MFFLPSARMGLEALLQVYPALKTLYVWDRTITRSAFLAKVCSARTQGDYGRSDSVTIMGVWSDGFSCARGPLSISQPSSRFASVGDNKSEERRVGKECRSLRW